MKVNDKLLFDEIIDSGDWFKHDMIKDLLGNAILYLGRSPGTEGERQYAIYLYKLIKGFKGGVEISGKRIHPEIRAGERFSILIYTPFLTDGKFPQEDETYARKFGIGLIYIHNASELKKFLKEFKSPS